MGDLRVAQKTNPGVLHLVKEVRLRLVALVELVAEVDQHIGAAHRGPDQLAHGAIGAENIGGLERPRSALLRNDGFAFEIERRQLIDVLVFGDDAVPGVHHRPREAAARRVIRHVPEQVIAGRDQSAVHVNGDLGLGRRVFAERVGLQVGFGRGRGNPGGFQLRNQVQRGQIQAAAGSSTAFQLVVGEETDVAAQAVLQPFRRILGKRRGAGAAAPQGRQQSQKDHCGGERSRASCPRLEIGRRAKSRHAHVEPFQTECGTAAPPRR